MLELLESTSERSKKINDLTIMENWEPTSSKKVGKCFNLFGKKRNIAVSTAVLPQNMFRSALNRERHRADRNGHCFSLVGFDLKNSRDVSVDKFIQNLANRSRITDEIGWFDDTVVGILLFNTPERDANLFAQSACKLAADEETKVDYDIWVYPSNWGTKGGDDGESQSVEKSGDKAALEDHGGAVEKRIVAEGVACDGDVHTKENRSWNALKLLKFVNSIPVWKRAMDIVGSLVGLLVLSPLFLLVAFLIKMVSPGPVIFKQERVGMGGKRFTLWKFRTMHVNNDTSEHQAALAEMIHAGDGESSKRMIKLDDKRTDIIRFGRIIRKTCIDEFPQLVNVLRGEMSLVGPRPPIPYEAQEYLQWHNGRFDAVPGMTGLWQVSGKNDLTFNEMARLDIVYSRKMSFWLDVEIILRTPLVIVSQVLGNLLPSVTTESAESTAA